MNTRDMYALPTYIFEILRKDVGGTFFVRRGNTIKSLDSSPLAALIAAQNSYDSAYGRPFLHGETVMVRETSTGNIRMFKVEAPAVQFKAI